MEPRSYFDLLLVTILWFIQTDAPDVSDRSEPFVYSRTPNSRVQVLSARFLQQLLFQARLPAHTSYQVST